MLHIARLLDIPGQSGPPSPAFVSGGYSPRTSGRGSRESRPLFHTGRLPEFNAHRRESSSGAIHRTDAERKRRERESPNRPLAIRRDCSNSNNKRDTPPSRDQSGNRIRSREGSPRMPRPKSEEIPLELIKKSQTQQIDVNVKVTTTPIPQAPRNDIIEHQAISSTDPIQTVAGSKVTSEETSFIAQENASSSKKKSSIETV